MMAHVRNSSFPSIATGASLRAGKRADAPIKVKSRMNDGGVSFPDGREQDLLAFDWGRGISEARAPRALHLVTG